VSEATDALGFTPNSAHELLTVEIVALITKLEGASPSAIVCLVRTAVSWSVGLRVVEDAVELVVEVLVVVVGAIGEVVVEKGRVVVGVLWLACPDPPPHAERVTIAARARNGPLDIGCRWALMGTVLRSIAANMRLAG
jgi:hypothetical protein